jgi:hypothetical protein
MIQSVLDYYREPGPITNLAKHKEFTDWLVADPSALYQVAQGLIVHDMWVTSYGIEYKQENEYPQKTAWMEDLLDKALQLDSRSLAIPRAPEKRVIACCREFATLYCALLRAKGIPARSRCGFATYFGWGQNYEDHWVTEWWNGSGWVLMDPQLDPLQQSLIQGWTLGSGAVDESLKAKVLAFNPRHLKDGEFINAGEAWKLCRTGKADPARFGIGCPIRPEWGIDSLYGLWFVRGQLMRDFAALNKVETVPYLVRICKKLDWKAWRLVGAKDEELTPDDFELLDGIAELSIDADKNFEAIRDVYETNEAVRVPEIIIKK